MYLMIYSETLQKRIMDRLNGSFFLRQLTRLPMNMITNTVYILLKMSVYMDNWKIKYNEYENWRNKR